MKDEVLGVGYVYGENTSKKTMASNRVAYIKREKKFPSNGVVLKGWYFRVCEQRDLRK